MKKILTTVLLSGISLMALAQNSKVRAAEDALKSKNYDEAKADIEAALQNDKTKDDGRTWYIDGEIHGAIAKQNKDPREAMKAFEYYKKADSLSPKSPEILLSLTQNLSDIYVVMGNAAYADLNGQKFDSAYDKFMTAYQIADFINEKGTGSLPTDTAMVFYTGYTANQSNHTDTAFAYFKRAAALHFSTEPYLYLTLAKMYADKGEIDSAMAILDQGKKIFPNNNNFALEEISIYQNSGKTDVLIKKMEEEFAHDPNNYAIAFNLAIAYDNMSNPHDAQGNDLPKPANADSLAQRAAEYYRKAIAIKPDEYAANFNLGLMYYNQAVEYGKQVGALGNTPADQKKADALLKQQDSLLNKAYPYLDKAYQLLDAKTSLPANEMEAYKSAITGLKAIYARRNDTTDYNTLDAKLNNADSKAQ
jgi:tetratricopeptide (TPR) repeat protein